VRVERIDWDGADPAALARRLRGAVAGTESVSGEVSGLIAAVRAGGDAALREIAERFSEPAPEALRVDPGAVAAAPGLLEPAVRDALRLAAANIEAVARAELEAASAPVLVELDQGQRVEVRGEPVAAAGVYAPGGRAAYPSSVLMTCVPARVAGVARLAVASPPRAAGGPSAPVLAAAAIAGVDEVYAVGGAQAIAALAHGTETIAPVDVIAGPGNRYVTEAKRQVSGIVGIDGIAGPSELVIVADGGANPDWLALDLCAQAEHGADSPVVLISPNAALIDRIEEIAVTLSADRPSVADAPLALVRAPGVEPALAFADAYAPEHLELAFDGADELAARARVAGCVFVGSAGATAFGDYVAGSNHVLPTGGAARFGGPLSPRAFIRRLSVVSIPPAAGRALAPHVAAIADAEGFPVHGESATARAKGGS
jgi:histidinol dehydrogenase